MFLLEERSIKKKEQRLVGTESG